MTGTVYLYRNTQRHYFNRVSNTSVDICVDQMFPEATPDKTIQEALDTLCHGLDSELRPTVVRICAANDTRYYLSIKGGQPILLDVDVLFPRELSDSVIMATINRIIQPVHGGFFYG